jgi:hypothetical protein
MSFARSPPPGHPRGCDALHHVFGWEGKRRTVAGGETLAPGVRVFHDGAPDSVAVLPIREGVEIDLSDFPGSYVSLAVALPPPLLDGIGSRHVLRLTLRWQSGPPMTLRARLNLRCGPNIARMLRETRPEAGLHAAEFDLWHLPFDAALLREGWIDLLAATAREGIMRADSIVVSRRWRAEF